MISNVKGTGLGVTLPKEETVGVRVADLMTGVALCSGTAGRLGVNEGAAATTLVGVD